MRVPPREHARALHPPEVIGQGRWGDAGVFPEIPVGRRVPREEHEGDVKRHALGAVAVRIPKFQDALKLDADPPFCLRGAWGFHEFELEPHIGPVELQADPVVGLAHGSVRSQLEPVRPFLNFEAPLAVLPAAPVGRIAGATSATPSRITRSPGAFMAEDISLRE